MVDQALSGVRVLDVSTVLAAPVTATLLGDFGADVVKVEEPGRGDFTRLGADRPGGRSLQWSQEGRNKRSVTLNLRTERGQEILRGLVPHFDVVITNYRPPTLEEWGMGPEALQRVNPRAILVYLTGYGLTGPYRDRGAFDRIASAFSGLTYVSGDPAGPPVRSGYSVIDFMSAYLAAFATMTALYHRDVHGGPGQVIDLALYEAGFRASENALLNYSAHGVVRERLGNKNPYIVPATDFDTADGRRVSIHAGTEPLFLRLCAVMGRPDLAEDERFASPIARIGNQDELYAVIAEWTSGMTADDVVKLLSDNDIPASVIMSIADIAADPHYRTRGTVVEVEDPDHGRISMAGPLPRMSATPGRIRSLGPELGASTAAILGELLGLDADDLADLRTDGII
ncbi:CaiB/BaiF CoA transferase family protein [Nocardia sp. CDC160]|uniref:CaiB/BaiF CoA transferase family protein n=1 Tax=Nocardia sp. CDC160 TaxID=3112166 RepID=UPI002DB64AB2|nr:CoA transferase [Nocardia sp. CDC160]MEC3916897.1 CoA transferase [Nocardia sp. CDC160]